MGKREPSIEEHKLIKKATLSASMFSISILVIWICALVFAICMANYTIFTKDKGIPFAIFSYIVQLCFVGLIVLLIVCIKDEVKKLRETFKQRYKVENCVVLEKKNIGSYKRSRVKVTVQKESGKRSSIILPSSSLQRFKIGSPALLVTYEYKKGKDETVRDLIRVKEKDEVEADE